MKIGVIGGAGAMGKWLTHYFKNNGHAVAIYDVDKKRLKAFARREKVSYVLRLSHLVAHNEVLLVSAPIEETLSVVEEILDSGARGKCIVEISSVKKRIVEELRNRADDSSRILSIHPLFGPGAQSLKHRRIAVIPVMDGEKERRMTADLFPEAEVFFVDADLHDRITALTISGTFLANMAWLQLASEFPRDIVRLLMGPAAKAQSMIAASYLTQDLKLYASISSNDEYTADTARRLTEGINHVLKLLGTDERSLRDFSSSFSSVMLPAEAYAALYTLTKL